MTQRSDDEQRRTITAALANMDDERRLTGAALDLLAAAKEALAWFEQSRRYEMSPSGQMANIAIEKLRAAIEKAENTTKETE